MAAVVTGWVTSFMVVFLAVLVEGGLIIARVDLAGIVCGFSSYSGSRGYGAWGENPVFRASMRPL